MAWISVWQEVDGPKLRKLAKALGSSKAEALGILNFLWFWGMNNADETGAVLEFDRWDLEYIMQGAIKPLGEGKEAIQPEKVVDSLFRTGWLDESADGCVFIHDWDQWQEQWYRLKKERQRNAERMREKRKASREANEEAAKPETQDIVSSDDVNGPKKEEEKKKPSKSIETEKVKYAEYVSMKETEYGKLIEKYGRTFADACIEELDNYKGAKKGRTYKDDYRAILSWVVDRVNEKRPGLMKISKDTVAEPGMEKNPFEEWGD